MLETKGIARGEEVKLPPMLRIIQDVTGLKEYYNYHLAKK
jgi:hypothetical protein